jgi:hypothetical protein
MDASVPLFRASPTIRWPRVRRTAPRADGASQRRVRRLPPAFRALTFDVRGMQRRHSLARSVRSSPAVACPFDGRVRALRGKRALMPCSYTSRRRAEQGRRRERPRTGCIAVHELTDALAATKRRNEAYRLCRSSKMRGATGASDERDPYQTARWPPED